MPPVGQVTLPSGRQPGVQTPLLQMTPPFAAPHCESCVQPHVPVDEMHTGVLPVHCVAFVDEHCVHAPGCGSVLSWQTGCVDVGHVAGGGGAPL